LVERVGIAFGLDWGSVGVGGGRSSGGVVATKQWGCRELMFREVGWEARTGRWEGCAGRRGVVEYSTSHVKCRRPETGNARAG